MSSPSRISDISEQYIIYTGFLIVIVGLIGNSLNIFVFLSLKPLRTNPCVFYLITESISNIGQLTFVFILRLLLVVYKGEQTQYSSLWCKFKVILAQIFLLLSIFMVCALAFDQFLCTNVIVYLRQMSSTRSSRRLVFVAVCFSIFHAIALGHFFDYQNFFGCTVFNPVIIEYFSFFFYPILCGLLPIVITGSFSLLAYRNVRRLIRRQLNIIRRRLDRQLTVMVLARVTSFILFKTPFAVYRLYSIHINVKSTDSIRLAIEVLIQAITNSFLNLDYALTFYIFMISSSRYRRQVRHVLTKKLWKRWFSSNVNQVHPTPPVLPPACSVELE